VSELSILIPARNEIFLNRTLDDILSHIEGDTEIIVILDGQWSTEPIPDHPRVTLVYHPVSIGQRAATNEAARLSRSKYLMKVDAHCAFDQGFDVKMMADMQDDVTMVPVMRNLHAFDWVCEQGHRRYQSPSGPCKECGSPTHMDIVWNPKRNPQSTAYRFDKDLHFQYWTEYKKQQQGDLVESMSIQGSCFLLTRQKYFELNICDERHGSWGQQGTEVACKTWLSGGRVLVNKRTWYAHLFRTQGGDFGFPYPNPGIEKARQYSRDLWLNNKWDKAVHPLEWLIEKFAPVPDWGK
jgi:glycosyltransferase involved in cell wall biosynthesis